MKLNDLIKALDTDNDLEVVIRKSKGSPDSNIDLQSDTDFDVDSLDDSELVDDVSAEGLETDDLEVGDDTLKVLQDVSSTLEGLIDDVMIINKNKEYSQLLKLLQSAGRLADELVNSEETL